MLTVKLKNGRLKSNYCFFVHKLNQNRTLNEGKQTKWTVISESKKTNTKNTLTKY